MRLALSLATVALTAAPLAGCGSSSDDESQTRARKAPAATSTAPIGATAEGCGNTTVAGTSGLRVTGVGCAVGRGVVAVWSNKRACSTPSGASRYSCTVNDGYRCLGADTDRGIAVSCAQKGLSISFVAKRGEEH
jgi:hypothetical protein